MARITIAADKDVMDKVDTSFVEQELDTIRVSIIFSCMDSEDWQDDTFTGDDGNPFYIIRLPYDQVKTMEKEQVQNLMLEKAKERLRLAA